MFLSVVLLGLLFSQATTPAQAPRGDSAGVGETRRPHRGPRAAFTAARAVDAPDRRGLTPLMWAAASGNTEVVRQLLDSGAAVDRRANDGSTALMLAVGERIHRDRARAGAQGRRRHRRQGRREGAAARARARACRRRHAARPGRGARPPAAAGRDRGSRHGRPPGARDGCAGQYGRRARDDRADDRGAQRRSRHAPGAAVERRRRVDSRQPGTERSSSGPSLRRRTAKYVVAFLRRARRLERDAARRARRPRRPR